MMVERPLREPTELLISGVTALLGLVLGGGLAYGLWIQLHHVADRTVLSGAVVALGCGLGLVAFASKGSALRLFLLMGALALLAAFFLGNPVFAALSS